MSWDESTLNTYMIDFYHAFDTKTEVEEAPESESGDKVWSLVVSTRTPFIVSQSALVKLNSM